MMALFPIYVRLCALITIAIEYNSTYTAPVVYKTCYNGSTLNTIVSNTDAMALSLTIRQQESSF